MPRSGALEDKPIKTLNTGATGEKAILDIPRRQRSVAGPGVAANGNGDLGAKHTNGTDTTSNKRKTDGTEEANGTTKKRPAPEASEDGGPSAKRSKVVQNGGPRADDDLIVLDDATDGAIVIDDD
jgi:ubiquitin-like 1-activating enzyme E1 B